MNQYIAAYALILLDLTCTTLSKAPDAWEPLHSQHCVVA